MTPIPHSPDSKKAHKSSCHKTFVLLNSFEILNHFGQFKCWLFGEFFPSAFSQNIFQWHEPVFPPAVNASMPLGFPKWTQATSSQLANKVLEVYYAMCPTSYVYTQHTINLLVINYRYLKKVFK